ncbi:putative RNA-binding Zn ribbon-like protein [Microbacteriaceae bacterium SG_E_30_P1]|uniref:RNA-binding Zn ribbon-like protein n=1 Tax=Antiquaquibacter oligotrophicus TaxID=2880260 RepID=A0ABT6KJB2_9MICO|nr:ABATE domain-containing protein [Antiquaquibacter oligotrophicus]MDH6179869.1 putative RNA-binding Zn ribbon-like protein [Antiquaquibacter oligotrophicus]UDF14370.1 CGNR zinc finger domain-containing protein [Antiquaquibacter oligotrophicus]
MLYPTTVRPTGQWLEQTDGPRWWFDSGALPLDFAYTGPMPDQSNREYLATPEDLAEWLEPRFDEVDGSVSEGDLRDARALREAIARAAVAASGGAGPDAADVDVINLYAAIPDIPPVLEGGGRRAGRSTARTAQALSVIARAAVQLFSPEERERIRACAADDCGVIFYDESRSNNRRWCSMARCGNRAKVREYRERRAKQA